MSIIYEAIKKVEKKKEKEIIVRKKKGYLFIIVIVTVIVAGMVYAFLQWKDFLSYKIGYKKEFIKNSEKEKGDLSQAVTSPPININVNEPLAFPKKDINNLHLSAIVPPAGETHNLKDPVEIPKENKQLTYRLEGIVYDPVSPLAVINGKMVRLHDLIDSLEIIEITPSTVKLANKESNITTILTLE